MATMQTGYFHRRSVSVERPLPSPTDTPYETPRVSSPRMSSFGTTTPTTPLTNSTSSIQNALKRQSQRADAQYDPDQITPTLHASLVSEILNLRREMDGKRDCIEDLEANLAGARAENDALQSNLRRQGKDFRALKRDLQLQEDGTLAALEAVAKERDEMKEANAELRRRLDASQRKFRSQEEDALRFKSLLEQEQTSATDAKRSLQRRADVAEQRLREVVEEVAASQAASLENSHVAGADARPPHFAAPDAAAPCGSPESTKSTKHKRNDTIESMRGAKVNLADELNFSDSNYDQSDDEAAPDQQRPQTPHSRNVSYGSPRPYTPTRSPRTRERYLARAEERQSRVLGMVSAFEEQMKKEEEASKRHSIESRTLSQSSNRLHDSIRSSTDLFAEKPHVGLPDQNEALDGVVADDSPRREAVGFPRPSRSRAKSDPSLLLQRLPTQMREPFQPSIASLAAKIESIESQVASIELVSTSTQTEDAEPKQDQSFQPVTNSIGVQTTAAPPPPMPTRAPPPVPFSVPEIAVHPPSSPSPHSNGRRRLFSSTRNKSVGVQTPSESPIGMKSVAVQTDIIRVDKRLAKLPAHLLPSVLDDEERARQQLQDKQRTASDPGPSAREFGLSSLSSVPLPPLHEDDDDFHAANQDIPLRNSSVHKPLQTQSTPVSPGLQGHGLGIDDLADDMYSSDTEYATRSTMARPSNSTARYGKRFEPPAPLPENEKVAFASSSQAPKRSSYASQSTGRSSTDRKRFSKLTNSSDAATEYQSRLNLMNRQSSGHSRSPSMGSIASSSNLSKTSGPRPPFIIPARRSSREQYAKIRIQREARVSTSPRRSGRSSPRVSERTSPERSAGKTKQRFRKKSPHNFLRKARSSAFIEGVASNDNPPPVPSLAVTNVTLHPPTVTNAIDPQKREIGVPRANGERLSTLIPTGGASVGSVFQHNVVDAITATTIGEWMYKYMRKRNAFGATEAVAEPGKTSDTRHKRWVWLSPYERTVMWSNKQPRSNTALLGKAGRKLTIQSVLDVKDETAPPKDAKNTGVFNRSILILTPDRALKFTAPTKDRHYLWLTALSFLSHQSAQSMQSLPKFAFQPPQSPAVESNATVSSGHSRGSSSIRNPLRTTKSKATSRQGSGAATPVVCQESEANTKREAPKVSVPNSAFAPTVPRVPHSRKRSMSATGVLSTRGRTGVTSNDALSGPPPSSLTSPAMSIHGGSSMRFPSMSRASSRPNVKQSEVTSPTVEFVPETDQRAPQELSPRPSGLSKISSDFGSNSNFFDAVGVVRMDAFSRTSSSRPGTRRAVRPLEQQDVDHMRQDSDSSFVGPPDIGRHRSVQRPVNGGKGENWKDF
ncbi:MAG: hypothetical protein Q9162_006960 [Coniocarpon cinnabarinum]